MFYKDHVFFFLLQTKAEFIYCVSKIHSLLNALTETIFIFVGINPRKSNLKNEVLMEFSNSRAKQMLLLSVIIVSHHRMKSDYIMVRGK